VKGVVGFLTQTIDQIFNSEKHGISTPKAIDDLAGGFAKMIADAPDQAAHVASVLFGSPNNPVSKLLERVGYVTNTPRLITGEEREAIRKEAVNSFYQDPSGLFFAALMVKGATGVKKQAEVKAKLEEKIVELEKKTEEAKGLVPTNEKRGTSENASRGISEGVAKESPTNAATEAQGQVPVIRGGVPEKGTVTEAAVSDLRQPAERNAPSELSATAPGSVAVSEVPQGSTSSTKVGGVKETQVEPPRSKYGEVKHDAIPDDLMVESEAVRARTGEKVKFKEPAKKALDQINIDIETWKKLINCLNT
jgi:hypothetical protein